MSIPEEYALNNLCAPGTLKLMVLYLFARASHLQTTENDMECTMMLFVEVTYFIIVKRSGWLSCKYNNRNIVLKFVSDNLTTDKTFLESYTHVLFEEEKEFSYFKRCYMQSHTKF